VGERLSELERLDWTGLKCNGKYCHNVALDSICSEAQRRLEEKRLDDNDALIELRCSGTHRVWGIEDGNVFMIIWWDPDHKICPSGPK
jgi:hypothetical protein